MSFDAGDETDAADQALGPSAHLRLHLRAGNLPKSGLQTQPDTFAKISWLSPEQNIGAALPPPVPPALMDSDHSYNIGGTSEELSERQRERDREENETEVVCRSSNPRWTASFDVQYEYGAQRLFFVDIFAMQSNKSGGLRASLENKLGKPQGGSTGIKHLGRAAFDVQDVLGSATKVRARRLRRGGVVYAHFEHQSSNGVSHPRSPGLFATSSLSSESQMLTLRLRADSLVPTHSVLKSKVLPKTIQAKPDTYFEVSRNSSGAWIVVYRSPLVKESVAPFWDEATVELSQEEDRSALPILIKVFKVKKRKCKEIGAFETTVAALIDAKVVAGDGGDDELYPTKECTEELGGRRRSFHLHPTPTGGAGTSDIITGNISVVKASIEHAGDVSQRSRRFLFDADESDSDDNSLCEMTDGEATPSFNPALAPSGSRPRFSDYVRAGMLDIDLCVAIDFTSSNGDPRIPGTQHYSRDGMMNDYEEAILALGTTIEKYSSSKEYPVWGFGAKYGGAVRHIFQCGHGPTATGTEGVLDAYRTVFETDLIMSGPTTVTSCLRAAAARSKKFYNASSSSTIQQYCVLLILTDGIVNDLQSTEELVQSYRDLQLPLSVVVVGIGRADFSEFHQLHDLLGGFSFVEFREHQFDPDALSRKALMNVPQEVVDYFVGRNILPPKG
ncbi:hypothetical protein ACHAXT_004962 [Thalassiosira profunda]